MLGPSPRRLGGICVALHSAIRVDASVCCETPDTHVQCKCLVEARQQCIQPLNAHKGGDWWFVDDLLESNALLGGGAQVLVKVRNIH